MSCGNRELYEPNTRRAFELVMRLMAIRGRSGDEAEVAGFVEHRLRQAGGPAAAGQAAAESGTGRDPGHHTRVPLPDDGRQGT